MNDSYDKCRRLYRAARAYESASQADRVAVRKALAAAVAVGATATGTGVSAAASAGTGAYGSAAGASAMGLQGLLHVLAGGKLLSGLLVGAALGTALSTTVYVLVPAIQSQAAPEVKARAPAASPPVRVNAKESSALVIAEPIRPVVSATPVSSTLADKLPRASVTPLREQGPARNPPLRSRSTDSSANGSDRLAEEAQALAQVQDALSRKDPGAAWALLQEQDRQFGLGQLAEERAAARVMALCGAGRYREAAQVRDTFFSSYPNSPLTNRVKKGCAQQ